MKPKLTVLACLLAGLSAHSQLKPPFTNNDLRQNLQKVVADFPNHLASVRGDTLNVNPQTIDFASTLDFKQAQENTITQYISSKSIYSWQASLLTTEDFQEAAKKYKWLCNQLKVMSINVGQGNAFSLRGDIAHPDESKNFFSSIFDLLPHAINMPKLKIEAAMRYDFPEWKVSLLVYEKEREDNERGEIKEN